MANSVFLFTQCGGIKVSSAEKGELRANLASAVRVMIDIPYDPALDTGSIIDWQLVGDPARRAFERASAQIAEGLLAVDRATSTHTINR